MKEDGPMADTATIITTITTTVDMETQRYTSSVNVVAEDPRLDPQEIAYVVAGACRAITDRVLIGTVTPVTDDDEEDPEDGWW